jgi:uncharacterized membrane protein
MNWAQAHLLLNHLPVLGLVYSLLIFGGSFFWYRRELRRAGLILFVITALGTIPVYMTGEPAEHLVRDMPQVDRDAIETHQDWATASLIAIEVLGVVALASLYLSWKSTLPELLVQACLLLALISFGIVGWTAHLGGQVHHPEVRSGFVPPPRQPRVRPPR